MDIIYWIPFLVIVIFVSIMLVPIIINEVTKTDEQRNLSEYEKCRKSLEDVRLGEDLSCILEQLDRIESKLDNLENER